MFPRYGPRMCAKWSVSPSTFHTLYYLFSHLRSAPGATIMYRTTASGYKLCPPHKEPLVPSPIVTVANRLVNASVQITEVVAGSLTNEVQRVTLRATNDTSIGTFCLETRGARAHWRGRGGVDGEHDDRYWTSQLRSNSTAEEVKTNTKVYF